MLRARLAVMEHRGLLQKYAVAELLPVLVISASLVLQVLLIIAGFTELATGIVVVMARINLVKKFVGVVGVVRVALLQVLQAELVVRHQVRAEVDESVVTVVVHHRMVCVLKIVIILSVIMLLVVVRVVLWLLMGLVADIQIVVAV